MKVLFIYPPPYSEIIGSNPVALEESRGYSPPLGLLFLAGYLLDRSKHDVRVLDAQARRLTYDQIEQEIRKEAPDVVGITAMTQTLLDVIQTVLAAKKAAPSSTVVLGGPHVHLFPEESIALPGVDFLVLGEGEHTFLQLLTYMGDTENLKKIPGLVFFSEGRYIYTGKPQFIDDLDALPFPARHLTDIGLYGSVLASRHPATTLFTSRGCPYVCSFCDRPHLGKRFRARSASNVVDEMEQCIGMGIHEFLIYDDTFTINKQRVLDICREISDRNLDLGFDVRARVDTVDREMLRAMSKAGCRGIHYGVEAGTEKILNVLRKGIDLHQVRTIFKETRAEGIQILAYFMIGSPSENIFDIKETFRMARSLDPDFIHLTILTPFPGTEIYRLAIETGLIKEDVWREFARNPQSSFTPPFWSENFTLDELNNLLLEGYSGFYGRPRYLVKRVLQVKSAHELVTKTRAGLRILSMRSKHGNRRNNPGPMWVCLPS